jgi:hypothetical protein
LWNVYSVLLFISWVMGFLAMELFELFMYLDTNPYKCIACKYFLPLCLHICWLFPLLCRSLINWYNSTHNDICKKEIKSVFWRDISISMFIVALFTMSKVWIQSKCPSTDEQIEKIWCAYRVDSNSTIKIRESSVICNNKDELGGY